MKAKAKPTLRPAEVARMKGRSLMAVYTAIWDGRLQAEKDCNGWHVDFDSATAWGLGRKSNN